MKHFFLSFLAGLIVSSGYASIKPDQDSSFTDTSFVEDNVVSDTIIDENMDNLIKLWYTQKANAACDSVMSVVEDADSNLSSIPDSVFIQRLARIPSVIPLTYNHIVRNFIEMYLYKKRDVLESVIGLLNFYNPIIDEIFDEYDVPNELKYMSVIESALNPRACSRTRAVGLWQFMYGTGKLYGLTINSLVDDRRDPIKSTHAAIKFSKDLYSMFGDWQLVIAAYNCGPGNVKKAMRRSGGKQNFWDIYYYLPRETRGHVPAYIAAVYVVNYYREHNVVPKPTNLPLATDTIVVHKKIHLGQIAEVLHIPLNTLRDLNPQYICDIVPAFSDIPYGIRIPMEYTTRFIDQEEFIRHYKDSIYFNPKLDLKSPTRYYSAYTGNGKRIVYIVKQGDNLGNISMRFHVSINQIKDWNGFNSNVIRSGQRLVIYVPNRYAGTVTQNKPSNNKPPVLSNDGKNQYYIVKEGDSIWEIAKKFPGTTADDIIRLNNLSSADKITPGQRLIITSTK
jgi:membrane-bound lytic murein transglycosylase D